MQAASLARSLSSPSQQLNGHAAACNFNFDLNSSSSSGVAERKAQKGARSPPLTIGVDLKLLPLCHSLSSFNFSSMVVARWSKEASGRGRDEKERRSLSFTANRPIVSGAPISRPDLAQLETCLEQGGFLVFFSPVFTVPPPCRLASSLA